MSTTLGGWRQESVYPRVNAGLAGSSLGRLQQGLGSNSRHPPCQNNSQLSLKDQQFGKAILAARMFEGLKPASALRRLSMPCQRVNR